ncbi:MAG: hypothetical protein JOS17DRAFT_840210 [Linnemannia elongata]|nr:MAG: hypothetical protein JOS17DRAFT_840210 [Linnemannia elongata]
MSKNPYFAHLPTWRNRQDLAYAIDSLPTILETLTASSPLLATYSYPSTSLSSSSSSSHSSLSSSSCSSYSSSSATATLASSCSSSAPSYSSPHSSTSSSYTTSSASAGSLSPAKSKTSAFKERIVLDLAKECHRSLSRSPSPSTTTSTSNTPNTPFRRVSGSIQPSQQQQQQQQSQQYHYQINRTGPSPYYPLQFSTRARAMAYLIEILQSLQKEPCGCDLVKGCYCGQDGIEDHEGKSPCYVCGEWYLDRRESSRSGGEGGGGYDGDVDGTRGGGSGSAQRQGKAWHEQGSLRHHVAEAKIKKWLDSVWKPPLTPATTPEQENVRQFGLRSQEDLRQCFDHPLHQHQYQQQQHHVRMEPGRPWNVHEIEIEARAKSRSRNNSASSTNSLSFVSSPSSSNYYYPPTTSASPSYSSLYSSVSPQQDLSESAYGYASGSGSWHFNTSSASPSSASKPIQATPPSQLIGPLFWAPQPAPIESRGFSSFGFDNQPQEGYQARVRTMSCSDAPPPPSSKPPSFAGSTSSASLRSSTPPVMRSHSMHTSHINSINSTSTSSNGSCRSKPVRASTANSTFAIPQEILDPNYKSPTFRIKSWNPASPASTNHSPATSSFSPIASRLAFAKESSSADLQKEKKKQTLDGWTSAPTQPAAVAVPPPSSSLPSSAQASVLKSSKMDRSDQEDYLALSSPDAGVQQGNTREDLNPIFKAFPTPTATPTPPSAAAEKEAGLEAEVEVKKSAPFQLNFTSSRFRAAVQAKASLDNHRSARRESVQKSAAFSDDNEEEKIHALPRLIPQIVATEDNDKERKKANIPVVDVVIVTEQVVLRDSNKAANGRKENLEPTTTDIIAQFKQPSTQPLSSRTLSIQKSAPLSPPTIATPTNASTSAKTHSSSSSAASTSTSTPTSASASNSTSQLYAREPKSPKKETEKNTSDVHQTTSWSSLQKLMRTVAVSATAAGPSSPAAVAYPVLGQSSSMLHVDASSSLAS